jgi:hypothetical protein
MKKVVLVGSYCDTPYKLELLIDLIQKIKDRGYDIIAYGKYPIPEHVQNMCDYWIYDKSNPLINNRTLNVWEKRYGKIFSRLIKFDWGFAAIDQLIKSLGFAKSLHYDVAYWLNYDVDLENFGLFESQCDEFLKNYNSVLYHWNTPHNAERVSLLSICFKVHESFEKLKGVVNVTNYNKIIQDTEFIAEDVFAEMLNISELSHYIIKDGPQIEDKIRSFGNRSNGVIPDQLVETPKYMNKCFVGFDTDKNTPIIFMAGLLVTIDEIVFDIGHNDLLVIKNPELGPYGTFEIDLTNKRPTKLIILSINGQVINEILDNDLDDYHYDSNLISNL